MKKGSTITEGLWKCLEHKTGAKKDKITNEDTLHAYVAACLLTDELAKTDKPLTVLKLASKIGKQQRRTEDIVALLKNMGLLKATADGIEVVG